MSQTPLTIFELLKSHHDPIAFLEAHSPHLTDQYQRHKAWLEGCLNQTPYEIIHMILGNIKSFPHNLPEPEMMRFLRDQKNRSSLVIALFDIFGHAPTFDITEMLTNIADALVTLAFKASLHHWVGRKKLPFDGFKWGQGTGLMITAMGKMGAFELNYSSDVDICVFFDPDAVSCDDPHMLYDGYVRVTQMAVKLLSTRTSDGYVYRTDLRLRPNPSSTKVAVPVRSAELYYERSGQNWERAAWIKGRFIDGDPASWAKFQTILRPFIWRKNLDYAAIQDIQSIKRQLHSHYKQDQIKVAGHDIKIGRGGIREIELYVQTQQLIGGGRDLRLRAQTTFGAMDALVTKGWVKTDDAKALKAAYCLFRKVEHRLQMVHDQQTHLIPTDPEALLNIARFCGCETTEDFTEIVHNHLTSVVRISNKLFAQEKPLGTKGNLVFTGHDDDPATINTLLEMGFKRPENVTALIRKWHAGAYRAMRSAKAREFLTEIMPTLLQKMSETTYPDAAIVKMDDFMSNLPAGVGLFSSMLNNPALMDLMIDIMGSAPELADYMARYPAAFDVMTDPNFYTPPTTILGFEEEFSYRASPNIPLDRLLNLLRRFNREQKFRIGVCVLRNHIRARDAGKMLSRLAKFCVKITAYHVQKDFRKRYNIPHYDTENQLVIVGLGSLGAGEMNAASDLDLLMVYRGDYTFDEDLKNSLPAPQTYYNKLGQRIISALSTHSEDGILYDVDMRLRPSGNAGPLVVSLERFKDYHQKEAHIWEHLALMRASTISGGEDLCDDITKLIHGILSTKRDIPTTASAVSDMRKKLLEHRAASNIWDIKLAKGGLFDLSFIVQYLGLVHAHDYPDILCISTYKTMRRMSDHGLIDIHDFNILSSAWDIFQELVNLFAVTKTDITLLPENYHALEKRMALILDAKNYAHMEQIMQGIYDAVQKVYDKIIQNT